VYCFCGECVDDVDDFGFVDFDDVIIDGVVDECFGVFELDDVG